MARKKPSPITSELKSEEGATNGGGGRGGEGGVALRRETMNPLASPHTGSNTIAKRANTRRSITMDRVHRSLSMIGLKIASADNNDDFNLNLSDAINDDEEEAKATRIFWVKVDTLVRFFKVLTAFPFVIVVASIQLSNKYNLILRSAFVIRGMNLSMYVLPFILVRVILSPLSAWVQKLAIALYLILYLFPVATVIFAKINILSTNTGMGEGTFCFKPARNVRFTQANFWAMIGFFFEWVQHVTYALPQGVVTPANQPQTLLKDYPPYLPFEVYFWLAVASAFLCGLIIIVNAILSGRSLYQFRHSPTTWFFMYNVGSPMYMTIVTILFYGLNCSDTGYMIQDDTLKCYSDKHVSIANSALIAIAIYLIQNTLLPTGTYKETMRENDLDIMFVPVYLQAHYLFKAILCYVYVFFYQNNFIRVSVLTAINLLLLWLNNNMKPCSVEWVNVLRDTIFVHASLSGIQSLNFLAWPQNTSTKSMLVSTLASNIVFITVCMYVYYAYSAKTPDYQIAEAFLNLEWQVSNGGTVEPRVLEQMISLTLSVQPSDWAIAENYIEQLVWLIAYPNMRVQFQSTWSLSNLALLQEGLRVKIHKAGGTHKIFEWFQEMDFIVQLESLACLANLSMSDDVCTDMISKYKCIPFFISLISSNKILHSRFASIALSNLARSDECRQLLREQGAIPILVGNMLSTDVQKTKSGCLGLANLALTRNDDLERIFTSKIILKRIMKIALSNDMETQVEIIALIRNLTCHSPIRPALLEAGVADLVDDLRKHSVYAQVRKWSEEIKVLMDKDISLKSLEDRAIMKSGQTAKFMDVAFLRSLEDDEDMLGTFVPLLGKVEWSTWGSKLDNIFSIVFAALPVLHGIQVESNKGVVLEINLASSLPRGTLDKWRGNMAYEIVAKPGQGKVVDFNPSSDVIRYEPCDDFVGPDFFTYTITLGGIKLAPATVSIQCNR